MSMCNRGSLSTDAPQPFLAAWLLMHAGTGTALGSVSATGSASCCCGTGSWLTVLASWATSCLAPQAWLLVSLWGVPHSACTLVQRAACCSGLASQHPLLSAGGAH